MSSRALKSSLQYAMLSQTSNMEFCLLVSFDTLPTDLILLFTIDYNALLME
jgi:hypothetical protein